MLIYAERARLIADETVASGRRPMDREFNSAIRSSVLARLELNGNDRLLDIGSGIGMLTVPLSYFVKSVTAVDHADVLARMPDRPNIEKLAGDFLTLDMGGRKFTKILAYSMVHYLSSYEAVVQLVGKALSLLDEEGLLLVGDMPNDGYRQRTQHSAQAQIVALSLGVRMIEREEERKQLESVLTLPPDKEIPDFSDDHVLDLLRQVRHAGHHAYLFRQPQALPFHQGREDVLIQKSGSAPERKMFVIERSSDRGIDNVGMFLRHVQQSDCDLLYDWSQDPTVRAQSVRSTTFSLEQHRAWFSQKMLQRSLDNLRWYILENALQQPVATVRYERIKAGKPLWTDGPIATADGGTEVSISIPLAVRGYGLAPIALGQSEADVRSVLPGPYIALIRPGNTPSLKAFAKVGYRKVGDEERLGVQLERWEKA